MSEATHFPIEKIRSDFPILSSQVRGKPLVYLDNAATTQKPKSVIQALVNYYETENSNIHRGVHFLSQKATDHFEQVRTQAQQFLNAQDSAEIIFVKGCTEAINLVANSYGARFQPNDEILISTLEHHSNIVPWQLLCEKTGAKLKVIPINDRGELLLDEFEKLLTKHTKLLAVSHLSNALGTLNPIQWMIEKAHQKGIPVLVDGAQAVAHLSVDVQALDCDFYAFSGHKIYAPTGIGVLYAKRKHLEAMPPYQGGGDMIAKVTFEETLYNTLPYKFEAGTPDIAGVVGLGAALDYVKTVGMKCIADYEHSLLKIATQALEKIAGLTIIGTAAEKASVLSFILEGIHPHDIGTILDSEGIAIRTGHHCAMPLMQRFNLPATARASFAFYNTPEEIEQLVAGIKKVQQVMLG